jgi:hypothetical protein
MSKGNSFETGMLAKVFKATALSWDSATFLTIHLHTAVPAEGDASTVNECAYTNYAPVDVARSGVGWDVTGNTASNLGAIIFNQCGGNPETIKGVSITPKSSTEILYSGALNDDLAVANLIQPQFQAGSLQIQED